ncbi:ABC transporter permease [Rathayibacter tritici]|nr:ABC transporter permease [Rathayibacter tritici]
MATMAPRSPRPRRAVFEYLLLIWRRAFAASLSEAIGAPVIYLLAVGLGLGTLVDTSDPEAFGGASYLAYIAPALLTSAALQIATTEGSYPAFARFAWGREFVGITATPVTPGQVADGQILLIAFRVAISAVAFYFVLSLFGVAGGFNGMWMIPVAVLLGAGCAAWSLAFGAWIVGKGDGEAFNILFRIVVLPMTLFSGTYFPISRFPDWLQGAITLSPLWHANELARGTTLGTLSALPAAAHVAILLIVLISGMLVARWIYYRRLVS